MRNTPTERFLAALYQTTGEQARRNGKGYTARCPAHDDRNPSLSISEGDDGRALVRCHAGCPTNAICRAVGLQVADLMPQGASTLSTSTETRQTQGKRQYRRRRQVKPTGRAYPTANEAVTALDAAMAKEQGRRVAQWTYEDANGDPVALVVRYDLPSPEGEKQQKTFRPVSKHAKGWRLRDPSGRWPPYRLPEVLAAVKAGKPVYICEGEKAADAGWRIGLPCTTSAHGANSPNKTDWAPLEGRDVVVLPDNDSAGGQYADEVVQLAMAAGASSVRAVRLPDLPPGGDTADLEATCNSSDDRVGLRMLVEQLADEAESIQPDRPAANFEPFQPFPTDALPEPIRGFVEAGARAIQCDSSFIVLPMLTALGAAIGNVRELRLSHGWRVLAIIWAVIVGESGTSKTPAFKLVMRPIRERQRKAIELHAEAMRQYDADLAHYDKALLAWKRDKKTNEPPPTKPDPPQAARLIVSDITVEALAPLLLANPRGVLLARDELAGWIGSFDRYAGGKGGADAAHWLSMHNGESIVVDRKTGNPRTIYVPQASVSVTGGIQPTILHRALGIEHRESGLAARLLLACPPRTSKRWTEADIDPDTEAEIASLFDRLYELKGTVDQEGNPRPVVVGLTPEAKAIWKAFYNVHAQEQVDLSGELSAAWSKLEEYAARLALVIHFARWAAGDPGLQSQDTVDAVSMEAGVELAQWFKGEARRVYSLLSESKHDQDQRRLIEWIERKGGSVTAREVQQGHRQYRTAQDAEAALEELAKAGCGQWHDAPTGPKGGRPSSVFRLSAAPTSTQPSRTRDSEGFVDVDSVDTPETQPDDDWGEL